MEISFKDILQIIKKNIVFVLIVSVIFASCSFLVTTLFIDKTYTSSIKLYVSANYIDNDANEDLSTYNYTSKLVATYIEMLNSTKFYNAVSESLEGKYSPSQLQSMITFRSVENTEVFRASVVSESPTEAKEIADAVAKVAPGTISELLVNNYQLKIVDEATIPKAPTSPSVTKNVLFAFLIGFVLSFVVAFARDYIDNKIKYNEEMTDLCGVPILATVPDFDSATNSKKYYRSSYKSHSEKGVRGNGKKEQ